MVTRNKFIYILLCFVLCFSFMNSVFAHVVLINDDTTETNEAEGSNENTEDNENTENNEEDTDLKELTVVTDETSISVELEDDYQVIPLDSPNFSLSWKTVNSYYQDEVKVYDNGGNELDPENMVFNDSTGQGLMPIQIIVGTTTTTTYNFGFVYMPDLDNSLASLKINDEEIDLSSGRVNDDSGITEYTVKISSSATSIRVEATLSDSDNFKFDDDDGIWEYESDSLAIPITIMPKDTGSGGVIKQIVIYVEKEGSSPGTTSSSRSSSRSSSISNPQTGNISMFVMAIILIASLVGSVVIYQKNIEGYK